MNIVFLLLGCSILIALVFLGGFVWSVRSGQYDDSYTPSVRMLLDPEEGPPFSSSETKPDPGQESN